MIPGTDLRAALISVWLILSAVLFAAAVSPWVLSPERLQHIFPVCQAKLRGESCLLCGMTTAWIRIAAGDLAGARDANAGSVWFWAAAIVNFAAAKAYLLVALLRKPFQAAREEDVKACN